MAGALDTNSRELTGSWLALNALGRTAPTQALGTAAYGSENLEALRVPSAQDPQAGSRVRVYDDSGLIDATLA